MNSPLLVIQITGVKWLQRMIPHMIPVGMVSCTSNVCLCLCLCSVYSQSLFILQQTIRKAQHARDFGPAYKQNQGNHWLRDTYEAIPDGKERVIS